MTTLLDEPQALPGHRRRDPAHHRMQQRSRERAARLQLVDQLLRGDDPVLTGRLQLVEVGERRVAALGRRCRPLPSTRRTRSPRASRTGRSAPSRAPRLRSRGRSSCRRRGTGPGRRGRTRCSRAAVVLPDLFAGRHEADAEAGGPPGGRLRTAAELQRRPARRCGRRGHLHGAAAVVERLAGERRSAASPAVRWCGPPACSAAVPNISNSLRDVAVGDDEVEPAARDRIDDGRVLGELQRVVEGRDERADRGCACSWCAPRSPPPTGARSAGSHRASRGARTG